MAENSKIEWTDHTFNAWIGCAKVSPGCEHCYAETLMDTRYGRVQWGVNGTRVRTSEANWRKPLQWDRAAADAGVRAKVFCASLADVFENRNDLIPWRQQLFHLVDQTPNLDWLILTKRPENVLNFAYQQQLWWPSNEMPKNVWIGTSVERQHEDFRIHHLAKIPATVRFLSMEPLLGEVNLQAINIVHNGDWGIYDALTCRVTTPQGDTIDASGVHPIDWVIVGGESGQNTRHMHPWWARYLRDQCHVTGTPFFFKQWGEWAPGYVDGKEHVTFCDNLDHEDNEDESGDCPECEIMARVGKSAAGRDLDGQRWSQFPDPYPVG